MRLLDLTALQLGRAIRAGEASAEEAAQAALDAIAARQPEHNAYITVLADQALERARALAGRLPGSPLAGVPAGVKDNICTLGVKTSCASKILGDFAPPYDATVMEKFHAAGGIMLGKLNMDEFAMGSTTETSFYGPVRNPWDPGPGARRLLRRRRRCGGGGGVLVCPGQRHRRLHPPACLLLRRHRHEAHLRHRLPLWPDRLRLLPGSDRPSGPVCRGLCRSAGHDPGPGRAGRHQPGCALRNAAAKPEGRPDRHEDRHSCGLLRGGSVREVPGRRCSPSPRC